MTVRAPRWRTSPSCDLTGSERARLRGPASSQSRGSIASSRSLAARGQLGGPGGGGPAGCTAAPRTSRPPSMRARRGRTGRRRGRQAGGLREQGRNSIALSRSLATRGQLGGQGPAGCTAALQTSRNAEPSGARRDSPSVRHGTEGRRRGSLPRVSSGRLPPRATGRGGEMRPPAWSCLIGTATNDRHGASRTHATCTAGRPGVRVHALSVGSPATRHPIAGAQVRERRSGTCPSPHHHGSELARSEVRRRLQQFNSNQNSGMLRAPEFCGTIFGGPDENALGAPEAGSPLAESGARVLPRAGAQHPGTARALGGRRRQRRLPRARFRVRRRTDEVWTRCVGRGGRHRCRALWHAARGGGHRRGSRRSTLVRWRDARAARGWRRRRGLC